MWGKLKWLITAFKHFLVILKDNVVPHCISAVFLSKGTSLNPSQSSIEAGHRLCLFFFLRRPSPVLPPSVLT